MADPFRSSFTLGFSTIAGGITNKMFPKIVLYPGFKYGGFQRETTTNRATNPRVVDAYSHVTVRWLVLSKSLSWRPKAFFFEKIQSLPRRTTCLQVLFPAEMRVVALIR